MKRILILEDDESIRDEIMRIIPLLNQFNPCTVSKSTDKSACPAVSKSPTRRGLCQLLVFNVQFTSYANIKPYIRNSVNPLKNALFQGLFCKLQFMEVWQTGRIYSEKKGQDPMGRQSSYINTPRKKFHYPNTITTLSSTTY